MTTLLPAVRAAHDAPDAPDLYLPPSKRFRIAGFDGAADAPKRTADDNRSPLGVQAALFDERGAPDDRVRCATSHDAPPHAPPDEARDPPPDEAWLDAVTYYPAQDASYNPVAPPFEHVPPPPPARGRAVAARPDRARAAAPVSDDYSDSESGDDGDGDARLALADDDDDEDVGSDSDDETFRPAVQLRLRVRR